MKTLLILATALTLASGASICDSCFDGICYTKSPLLKSNYHYSGQVAIDTTENIVYFHYKNTNNHYTASYDLNDIRFKLIPNIDFSFARAVDKTTRDVYIGGEHGIFKYNPLSNTTVRHALFDKTIWHMQYKNKIYYTVFQTKGLYYYDKKQSKSVGPLSNYNIDDFVIDKKNDIYFVSDFKVFRLNNNGKQAKVFTNDSYALLLDIEDNVYFINSFRRGLYKLDYKYDRIKSVGAFRKGSPFKAVFDDNFNIVYYDSDDYNLYYLMPNYNRCTVVSRIKKNKKFGPNDDVNDSTDSVLVIIDVEK